MLLFNLLDATRYNRAVTAVTAVTRQDLQIIILYSFLLVRDCIARIM